MSPAPRRCIAPTETDDDALRAAHQHAHGRAATDAEMEAARRAVAADPVLCGAPATTERTVEGLVCPLCEEHAAEIDREAAS